MIAHIFKNISAYLRGKSSPAVSLIVLIIAISSINAWQLVLPNFAWDNSFGIAAAKNIYDGNGYTLNSVSHKDLFTARYDPLNNWPPGYSYLLALIKRLTNTDWIVSFYILNAIGCMLLILALRKILVLLQIPSRTTNIYLLFAGLIPYPFLSVWFSDLLAVTSFMWAMALLLNMIVPNRNQILYGIFSGLLFGFCAWLKYLYLPISLVPFIFMFFYAWKTDNRKLAKAISGGGIFLLASILSLLWFQQKHSGQAVYINPTGTGFFPESILHIGPVVPASLIDFRFFNMQFSSRLNIPYQKVSFLWPWLNVLLSFSILFLIIRFYRKNGFLLKQPLNIYMTMALTVSASIFILLICLSLTQGPYSSEYVAYWTYTQELRYYAPVLIFIPQGILFIIIFQADLLKRTKKIWAVLILVIVLVHTSHGLYYLSKQVLVKREIGKNRPSEQLDLMAFTTASHLLKSDKDLIVCSDDKEISNIASLTGIPVLYEFDSLNSKLQSSKPVTLLVVLNESRLTRFKKFFLMNNPELLFTSKALDKNSYDTKFYIVKIY